MTRQGPVAWELKWIDKETGEELGKSIYAPEKPWDENIFAAGIEQLYALRGPAAVAHFLSTRLRNPSSQPRAFFEMIARMIDPSEDGYLKLVVERRRSGKRWTRRANDAALAKAVTKYERALGNKRGSRKAAVGAVADLFNVGEGTVRKALRNLNSK
jgi:hypothetical protein